MYCVPPTYKLLYVSTMENAVNNNMILTFKEFYDLTEGCVLMYYKTGRY